MVTYKAKVKDHRLILRVKVLFGENIDEKALSVFARAYLRGFLKPKLIKKNVIDYVGPIGVSLHERFKDPITKKEFLSIMEQVVLAVQKLQNCGMPLNKLVLDLKNVYVNTVTKEVQFLYLPLDTNPTHADIPGFMEAIIYSVKPAQETDMDYVSDFVNFWKTMKVFDVSAIEMYIAKQDKELVTSLKKQNAGQSGFITDKQREYVEHYNSQNKRQSVFSSNYDFQENDEDTAPLVEDEATGRLDEDSTGLLGEDTYGNFSDPTGRLENDDTCLLGDDWFEGTALLIESPSNERTYPTLERVSTGEVISLNKPVFRLGKEKSYVDYFVSNNNAVSRSHADIIARGNSCFVTDLNSTNHTFINDEKIPPNAETPIGDGDKLKLGNEEFIFHF